MFGAPGVHLGGERAAGGQLRVAAFGRRIVVFLVDGLLLFRVQGGDGLLVGLEVGRTHGVLHADARAGFVDGVDGLVRQQPGGQIAGGELHGGAERALVVLHVVVLLVARSDAAEDFHGFVLRRLVYGDGLESALERGVLFDGLVVFLEGRRAHHLQFAARKGGLEDVGRVHRALGAARAHERMDLVEEQHHVAHALRLFDELLEAFLELAAVLRAGDDARHVERHDALLAHALGHFAGDDRLRETLHDGGLAHARLADQHGVVLRAARQHLDDAGDFGLAADDGIELALAGKFREVAAKGVQGGRLLLLAVGTVVLLLARSDGLLVVGIVVAFRVAVQFAFLGWRVLGRCVGVGDAVGGGGVLEAFGGDVVAEEQLRADRFAVLEHGQHEMFGADGIGLEAVRLQLGAFENLARAGGDGQFADGLERLAAPDKLVQLHLEVVGIELEAFQPTARLACGHR